MLPNMPESFPQDTGHSSDMDLKKNGMLRSAMIRMVYGTRSPTKCLPHIQKRATGELLLRVIVSVTQFSVYGAVAGWRQDLARQIEAHSPPSEGHKLRTWRMIPRLKSHQSTSRTSPNHQFGFLEHKETGSGNTKGNSKLFQMTFN